MLKTCGLMVIVLIPSAFAAKPDFWDISSSHVVNLYESHRLDSKVVAVISSKAQKLKNFGCKSTKKSTNSWCKVEYREQAGWIEARFLTPTHTVKIDDTTSIQNELSINCNKIEYRVDRLICNNATLKMLEENMSLIYEQALSKSQESTEIHEMGKLITSQKEWANKRNECWKAEQGMESCVKRLYESRLNELQTYWKIADIIEENHFTCEDGSEFILTQFNTQGLGTVTIEYGGQKAVLIATPTNKGKKFGLEENRYVWLSNKDALFVWDEQPLQHCQVKDKEI